MAKIIQKVKPNEVYHLIFKVYIQIILSEMNFLHLIQILMGHIIFYQR